MNINEVLRIIVLIKQSGKNPTIRLIAKLMSKEKSLRSIQLAIDELIERNVIYRDDKKKIQITNTYISKDGYYEK